MRDQLEFQEVDSSTVTPLVSPTQYIIILYFITLLYITLISLIIILLFNLIKIRKAIIILLALLIDTEHHY